MIKSFSLYLIFCLISSLIFILPPNSYAENEPNLYSLIGELGVGHLSYLNQKPISDIPEGRVIVCWVTDSSKLGFFQNEEWLELKKIANDKWEIKNPETGDKIEFSVMYEAGQVKVVEISSTTPKLKILTNAPSYKPEDPYFIAFKGGIYHPTGDLDDYDTGFYGEIALNGYFSPNFALEAGIGYFETSDSGDDVGLGRTIDQDIYVIPLTVSLKGIMPFKVGEVYLGAGIGGYYVNSDLNLTFHGQTSDMGSDDDFTLGFQLFGGLDYNITDKVFIGFEGKYIYTDEAEVHNGIAEFNLNGIFATGIFGFRF
jgi:opacity protein-like surface antigen